jgi:hypothetical protein
MHTPNDHSIPAIYVCMYMHKIQKKKNQELGALYSYKLNSYKVQSRGFQELI